MVKNKVMEEVEVKERVAVKEEETVALVAVISLRPLGVDISVGVPGSLEGRLQLANSKEEVEEAKEVGVME